MSDGNPRLVPVNGAAVRQRLHDLRLSERELANSCGFTASSIRGVVANGAMSSSFTLAELRALKSALGLSWSDLFVEPRPEPTGSEDVPVLVQVLTGQTKAIPEDRLARVLGWDLDRLKDAAEAAVSALAPVGLTIHVASTGLQIRAVDDQAENRSRLESLRDDETGISQSAARVLREAWTGELSSQEDRNNHQIQLGRLHNLGVLEDRRSSGGRRHAISDDTAFCFDF